MSTTFHASFNEQRKDFATDFGATLRVLGGSLVTIGGETVAVLPVDEYVAERLAALVNSAPETLDTLAEIAAALGDDPNFATTVLTELGKKVDKQDSTGGEMAYIVTYDNKQTLRAVSASHSAYALALRHSGGVLRVGTAVGDNDAVPLKQMRDALDDKADKTGAAYHVPCTNGQGEQISFSYSQSPNGTSFALRRDGGSLDVGTATEDAHAVPLSQLNAILDERIGDLDAALDEVLALQAYYTGETFDVLHEHAERVIAGGEA